MKHIKSAKEKLAEIKEERLQEILNDNSLTKIERLKFIEEEKLFGYFEYVQNEFPEWEKDIIEMEKSEAVRLDKEAKSEFFYHSKMVDSITHSEWIMPYIEKHETVSYPDLLEKIFKSAGKETARFKKHEFDVPEWNEKDPMIPVLTTRSPIVVLWKPFSEVVDVIYNYAVDNKMVGFKYDW